MRDESNLNRYSDTDLSEYIPFSENNKLVKIESPTFHVESEHPKMYGAFALYPVYAAAVEATYHNVEKLAFGLEPRHWDTCVTAGTSPEAFEMLLYDEVQWRSDMIFMLQPSEIGELVIISRKDNTNPNVQRLTDWFLSPQGQELVQDVGYVPL